MAYLLNAGIALSLTNTPTTTAAYASGGAAGATSVVISTTNPSIVVGQDITGTGFAGNTKVTGVSGTTISFSPAATSQISGTINFKTWYYLTDHNRRSISIVPELIQKESRMANGTLKKFVVSKKDILSTSWDALPSSNKQATPFTISSATVSGSNIIYVTSSNHNFSIGSLVNVSGFSNDKLNVNSSVISLTNNSFMLSNPKGASDGLTTATASVIETLPSITTVDGNYGASWLSAFYNANVGVPVYLKLTSSRHTDPAIGSLPTDTTFLSSKSASKIYNVFITNFNSSISARTRTTDYVSMDIEFTEI